jgi:cobalt/nickel transport system permease protein
MSAHVLDRYVHGASPVHRLDARVKFLLVLAFIVSTTLLPDGAWLALTCLTALVWMTVVVSGVGLLRLLRRALVATPFLLVLVSILFVPGRPLLDIPLGFVTLTVSDMGVLRFASVLWRSWLALQAALLLTATTHFIDILRALRALRLPAILVAILSFAYRYLFILSDEAQRLLRARDCRSAALEGGGGGSVLWRAKVTGRMAGTLFLRAFERSERVYVAMVSRGYAGEIRSLGAARLSRDDRLVAIGGTAVLALVVLQAYS